MPRAPNAASNLSWATSACANTRCILFGQSRGYDRNNAVNASWLDRGDQERCITYGLPSASLPTLYNNNIRIVQAPGTAVIVHEMIHEARVVPLDGRPRLNDNVRAWIGDTRGRWEGDTLVVETTNFNGKHSYRGSTTGLHLTERYTLLTPDVIRYDVTIEDPNVFTQPWRISMPLYRRMEPNMQLLDYRCTEFVEEFLYGAVRKNQLVKRWEGETMIVDITRKIPPEEKFYEWFRR